MFVDSDMGDSGEGYPQGTRYVSNFTGAFEIKDQIDDYTYLLSLKEIHYFDEIGTEKYDGGVKYIYTDAYGLSEDNEFILSLPGTNVDELSEVVLSWIYFYGTDAIVTDKYVLYGVDSENAFSGSRLDGYGE